MSALDSAFAKRTAEIARDADWPHFLKERIGGAWVTMGLFYSAKQAMDMRANVKAWFRSERGWVSECGNYQVVK